MNRLLRTAFLLLTVFTAACSQQAPQGEATPEVVPEVTLEVSPQVAGLVWETYVQSPPTAPGWVFQHPAGWQVVDENGPNVFLYSAPDIGERLFSDGLQPSQLVFQFSYNPASVAGESATDHLAALTSAIPNAALSDPQPVTIAGLDGVQQQGVIQTLGLTVTTSSRQFLPNSFIDIIAYSRTDEFGANLPLINAVIDTARYVLATE